MCGLNGITFSDRDLISEMQKFTKNRGPDASGIYSDENITLSHDRLSIQDLSQEANQPMIYENFVISYKGEIYNYSELKEELQHIGYKFKTTSDTEVILYLFHKYNIEAFKKLSGIFAISIWDKNTKKLFLIRDTIGVKPLYYFKDQKNDHLYFSSSIKSLLLSSDKILNVEALNYFSNMSRNDSEETIFKNIFKLLPGYLLIYSNKTIELKNFLRLNFNKKKIPNKKIKDKIENIIKSQFISDVPLALSLSGGVDSNIVYSVLRKKLNKKFNIYSFRFPDYEKFNQDFNVAKDNAEFYKDNFIPIEINHNDFIDNAEKVTEILEEPIGNQCSILNYVMSKKIKEKVLLTGDGGDETFTGYDQYKSILMLTMFQKFNVFKFLNIKTGIRNIDRLFFKDAKDYYLSFSEQNMFKEPEKYFSNFKKLQKENLFLNHANNIELKSIVNNVGLLDIDTRVANDYLLRNDKIFAQAGIEVRVPLLDTAIIENFLQMSEYKKFNYMLKSKGLLKKIFEKDIHSLVKRKWGMQSPYAKWMKGPLQNFLKEILSPGYYKESNKYFNFVEISKLITKHKEEYYNPHLLWSLVMLQICLRKFKL